MLDQLPQKEKLTRDDLISLLKIADEAEVARLYQEAYEVKAREVGRKAYYRGLLEFSNRCRKNCCYCGIRAGNDKIERFDMTKEEILRMAQWAYDNQYGSLTLQSGERNDPAFIEFIDDLLAALKNIGGGRLGLTLCLGEQTDEVYKKWFDLGAHRYLLRIETSNPALYKKLHPDNAVHSFETRLDRLRALKRLGYQLGTGVMIGLPGQTEEDLADDILFFERVDADMIGMGPYVVHQDTPVGREVLAKGQNGPADRKRRLTLGLKMIALTRLYLKNVNIAATTALQALDPFGRELGLKAGANILMPIITSEEHRAKYLLYENKPCVGDNEEKCRHCLTGRVRSIGEEVGFGQWGDSPHAIPQTQCRPVE
jgi:biotin synthase